jgi:dUTP pyrophosphatase
MLPAGLALSSAYDRTIPAFGKAIVVTNLALLLPPGCYGRIAPLSGLTVRHHISVLGGLINAEYRGNKCVVI